jgi:hypothetical protein
VEDAESLDARCDKVRHDSDKLAALILEIAEGWRHPL